MKGWTLARRFTTLVGLGTLGVLVALLTLVGLTAGTESEVDNLVNRTQPARRIAGDLLTTLIEQQNSVRGYALSADPTRLGEFQAEVARRDRVVANLRGLLPADDEVATAKLDRVVADIRVWRTDGAEPLLAAITRDGPGPAMEAVYQVEEQLFVPVVASATDLVDHLETRRDADAARLDTLQLTELIVLLAATVVAGGVGVATLLLLRRWVTVPVRQLAADARQVADGDHGHQVSVSAGPPEITAMAADVERMRSQIVTELAEQVTRQDELRWFRDQLQSQAVDLQRSNRDLEQFAYVASHDLQEPLRKVSGFCQLLQRRYAGQLDDRADQYIEFAVDGAQRMQLLITDLLAFSRVGRTDRAMTVVELAEVAGSAVAELADVSGFIDAQITVGELPAVHGDPVLLGQLLTNLVGNALKFHRPDESATVRVEAVPDPIGWQVSVSDDGIGIEPEFADKIFVLFGRLHSRDSYSGTGIGLALAKRIVEYHGGRIWLDTAREDGAPTGTGTTIRFTLPAAHQEQP